MTVYLVHFDRPIGGEGRNGAQHYLGWTEGEIDDRMREHRKGGKRAAAILSYLKTVGVGWRPVRVWLNADRHLERRLKNGGHFAALCPICAGEAALRRGCHGHATEEVA